MKKETCKRCEYLATDSHCDDFWYICEYGENEIEINYDLEKPDDCPLGDKE